MSRRMVKTGSVHVAAKNLRQPLCGQNNVSKRCVRNARCQTGLNFGERSKFAVATFLSLAVCERKGLGTRLSSRRILTECGCGCQIFISTPQRTVARSGQPWLLYEGGSKFCQALPHRGPGSGLEG